MADDKCNPRWQPCYVLLEAGIPCVVWCEDAVATFGVPTCVFDLYVLVTNINDAAQALIQKGWSLGDNTQSKFGNAPLESSHCRMTPPNDTAQDIKPGTSKPRAGPTTTILLPAVEWNFVLPSNTQHPRGGLQTSVVPPLPALLDAFINKLLDDPLTVSMFWLHLVVLIGYLYEYVPVIGEKSFAEKLNYDHRQFHFDWLSGMTSGIPFIRHERLIRDALRKGQYELKDCSADRDDETFFKSKIHARIIASQPSHFSHGDYEREKREALAAELEEWMEDKENMGDAAQLVSGETSQRARTPAIF